MRRYLWSGREEISFSLLMNLKKKMERRTDRKSTTLSRLNEMMTQHALSFLRSRLGCHSRENGNPIYDMNMWSRRIGSRLLGNDRLFWSPPPINPFEGRLHGNDIACWAMLAGLPDPARLPEG